MPKQFIEKWEYEGEKRIFSDRFPGHSVFISNDNPDRAGSLLFGQLIGRELKTRGLQYTPHYVEPFMGNRRRVLVDADAGVYRFDQLVVLRMTRMPAVLLEAGSIIHRDEELKLLAPERRMLITESVAEAVASFCTQRSKPNATVARTSKANPTAARTSKANGRVGRQTRDRATRNAPSRPCRSGEFACPGRGAARSTCGVVQPLIRDPGYLRSIEETEVPGLHRVTTCRAAPGTRDLVSAAAASSR